MNTGDTIKLTECENACVTCLRTTNTLYPMSLDLKTEYIKFVDMVKEEMDMMICYMCRRQLQRCIRFKQQCQAARDLLNMQNINEDPQKISYSLNLQLSKIEIYYINESKTRKVQSRSKAKNHGSLRKMKNNMVKNHGNVENDLPMNHEDGSPMKHENGSPVNHENGSPTNQENGSPANQENGSLKTELINVQPMNYENGFINDSENVSPVNDFKLNGFEDDFDSAELNNEDDVPLLLLKKYKSEKRKKKKNDINEEIPKDRVTKKEKIIKDGFTSRMVQETDEYTVIKLTKEQVLQEMEERSKTEMYLQSSFKCEKCVKGFNFQDVLNKHMEKHTKEIGPFQCDMCFQYCRSAVSLRGHIKSHTTRYKCKICNAIRLSRQHLLEHHADHTRQQNVYACNACAYTTSKRTVMQRHVRSHAHTEPHACERCGKLFKSVESLRVHTARHEQSSRLRCEQCPLSFVYRSLLRRHVARAHDSNDYYCVECDARFKSSESLRLHFKKAKKHRDSSSYKYACELCPSRAQSAGARAAHMSRAHGAARRLACALCARRYSGGDALRAHTWRQHSQRPA